MSFSQSAQQMDSLILNVMGTTGDNIVVQFTPQDNSGTQIIDAIFREPAKEEQFTPGAAGSAPSVIRLFVAYSTITPLPKLGDVITISAINYSINELLADAVGGAVLKMRKF